MEIGFILLPFFTGLLCYFFRRSLGTTAITWISLQSLGVSLIILMYNLIDVFTYSAYKMKIITLSFSWIKINNVDAEWSLMLDTISLSMSALILIITFLVQTYSLDYMRDDINKGKFFVYLLFFAFFMLLFVTSGNIMQMFIGWEGVGLVSFLLINFWHTRLEANRSAVQAILFNKIGDIGFYFFIVAVFFLLNSFDIVVMRELMPYYTNKYIPTAFETVSFHFFDIWSLPREVDVGNRIAHFFQFYFDYAGTKDVDVIWFINFKENDFRFSFCELCCFFIITAAAGKSAQLGLHGWLPSAMEGPTPVSSLLHSATMVTAGVYLLIRFNFMLVHSPRLLSLLELLGGFTAFYAGCIALLHVDIKKIIAYSTCSQLGYMVAACGEGAFNLSFFHLYTHAFFKCLLFLTSGAIIHSLHQEQDLRRMGGLKDYLPSVFVAMLIGFLGLVGMPFFSGFFSKESILISIFTSTSIINKFLFYILFFSAILTCFYSVKCIKFIFFSNYRGSKYILQNAHECSKEVLIPLCTLSILTIFFGFLSQDFFIGLGTTSFGSSLIIRHSIANFEIVHFYVKYLPLLSLIIVPYYCNKYYRYYFAQAYTFTLRELYLEYIKNGANSFPIQIIDKKETQHYHFIPGQFSLAQRKLRVFFYFFFYIYFVLAQKWYWGGIYKGMTMTTYKTMYKTVVKTVDRGYLEYFGSFGITKFFNNLSRRVIKTQRGILFDYYLVFFFGVFYCILMIYLTIF
jgi:NADH-quinone oxidoreductase subunit L